MIRLFLLAVSLAAGPAPSAAPAPTAAPRAAAAPTPTPPQVMLSGKPVFEVRTRVASFSAEERARAISERLEKLAEDPLLDPATLTAVVGPAVTDVLAGKQAVFSVTDDDAAAAHRPRADLARDELLHTQQALTAHRTAHSLRSILLDVLYAVLTTAGAGLLFWGLTWLMGALGGHIEAWVSSSRKALRIQNVQLITPERAGEILVAALQIAHTALGLVLLYVYLSLVLRFFPWTRGFSRHLFGYVLDPLRAMGAAVVGYLPRFFFVVVAIFIAVQITRLVRFLFREIEKGNLRPRGFHREWARPTYQLARVGIVVFSAVVIFPYLPGAHSSAFQNVSIFVGVLLSLGSSSAVANGVAGVILTYTRAFKVGDQVEIGDAKGNVMERTLLVTRVRSYKNVDISIPNALVLSSHVRNFSTAKQGVILHTSVTIGYDVPWRKVHELLREAARGALHVQAKPEPFILQNSLDDFYVSYQLNVYTAEPKFMNDIYSDLHQRIQDSFFAAGVEIMSAHYSSLRDGNAAAIPADKLPADYAAPSFRVGQVESAPPRPKKDTGAA